MSLRVLGGDERGQVPLAGVAGEADQERPARAPALHEVGLVEADELARLHRAAVAAAHGEPVGGVQHRQGQLLLGRPVLPLDLQVGQPEAGHRDDGEHRLVGRGCRAGGEPKNSMASGISAVSSSRLPSSWRVGVGRGSAGRRRCRPVWTSPRPARSARRAAARSRSTPRGRPGAAPASSRCPARACAARPGRWRRRCRTPGRRPGPAGKCCALRRRDQRVRRQRALLGAGQVEHPGERPQLGHLAQPGQRAGRVEQRDLDAAAGGQVAEGAEQCGLSTAGLGDEHGQAGALADLHREVQVEEDRPPRRAGRTADEVAAAVAHCGRRLGQRGGEQLDRHPAQVAGVGQRLARDELAGQRLLALRVLQRDPQLALVELDHPAGPLEALLAGRRRTRPAGASRAPGTSRRAGRWSSRRRAPGPAGRAARARAARPCRARRSRAAGSGSCAAGARGCGTSRPGRARPPATRAPSARAAARGSAATARAAPGSPAAPSGRR